MAGCAHTIMTVWHRKISTNRTMSVCVRRIGRMGKPVRRRRCCQTLKACSYKSRVGKCDDEKWVIVVVMVLLVSQSGGSAVCYCRRSIFVVVCFIKHLNCGRKVCKYLNFFFFSATHVCRRRSSYAH